MPPRDPRAAAREQAAVGARVLAVRPRVEPIETEQGRLVGAASRRRGRRLGRAPPARGRAARPSDRPRTPDQPQRQQRSAGIPGLQVLPRRAAPRPAGLRQADACAGCGDGRDPPPRVPGVDQTRAQHAPRPGARRGLARHVRHQIVEAADAIARAARDRRASAPARRARRRDRSRAAPARRPHRRRSRARACARRWPAPTAPVRRRSAPRCRRGNGR